MKSIYKLFTAAAAILVGCSDNDTDYSNTPCADMIDVEIAASGHETDDEGTRVEYDDRSLIWESGDEVTIVVTSQSSTPATLTAKTGGSSTTILSGSIPRPADIDDYYAVYPSSAVASVSGGGTIATLSIPATQGTATKPVLTGKCQQSAAADLAMTFTPATAILDITVSQPVISVLFEASNGEAVAGDFSYDIANGAVYDITSLSGKSIEYLGGSGQTRIRLLVPARSLSQGYKLTLTDTAGGKMVQSYGYRSGLSLTAGKAYPVNIDFVPISITMGTLQTTYSRYLSGDLTGANDFSKRLTVSGADVTIAGTSSTMIEEAGYYIGEEKHAVTSSTKSFAIPDFTVSAQGSYSVSAYAVINGTEYRSAAQECIITGLPLESIPPTQDQGWSEASWNVSWNQSDSNGSYVKIGQSSGSGTAQINSPQFYIPTDININIYNYSIVNGNTTYRVNIGNNTLFSVSNSQTVDRTDQTTLQPSANQIYLYSSYWSILARYVKVYKIIITYR